MATTTVLDISKWQNKIDYTKLANSATISGVIMRAGYRGMNNGAITKDPMFDTHLQGLLKNKMPIGIYFFSTAITEAEGRAEGEYCVKIAQDYKLSFPVFIDTEFCNSERSGRSDKLSKEARTNVVLAFCKAVKDAGFIPGIYANDDFFVQNLNYEKIKNYKLWVARYSTKQPSCVKSYIAWQYTSKGKVAGYNGNVDLSHWYADINFSAAREDGNSDNTVTNVKVEEKVEAKPLSSGTSSLTAGTVLSLKQEPCYNSSTSNSIISKKTGTFYVWSSAISNGRIRITNIKTNVGVAGKITGWIKVPSNASVVSNSNLTTLQNGSKLYLDNVNMFNTSTTKSVVARKTGVYYVWSVTPVNQRVRITNSKKAVGVAGQITGWISVQDAKASLRD